MNKLEAIQYLAKNSVYVNEWQGAGMWEAVLEILQSKEEILDIKYINSLLKKAEDR